MTKTKDVRSVSFHKEKDQELLQHIENVNFSGYVKELIQADIARRNRPMQIIQRSEKGGIKIVVGK